MACRLIVLLCGKEVVMNNLNDLYQEMIACDRFGLYRYYEIVCKAYLYKLKKLWNIQDNEISWVNNQVGTQLRYGWDDIIPMKDVIFIVCNKMSEDEYFQIKDGLKYV